MQNLNRWHPDPALDARMALAFEFPAGATSVLEEVVAALLVLAGVGAALLFRFGLGGDSSLEIDIGADGSVNSAGLRRLVAHPS